MSEACDQIVETAIGSDELALSVRPVCRREARYPIERAGAPKRKGMRPAIPKQRVEHLSYRD